MDGLQWKTLLKWMIWGYPYFRKPPYIYIIFPKLPYIYIPWVVWKIPFPFTAPMGSVFRQTPTSLRVELVIRGPKSPGHDVISWCAINPNRKDCLKVKWHVGRLNEWDFWFNEAIFRLDEAIFRLDEWDFLVVFLRAQQIIPCHATIP